MNLLRLLCLLWACLPFAIIADDRTATEDFAYRHQLITDQAGPVQLLVLEAGVYTHLVSDSADDLAVFDDNGRPVPISRLGEAQMIEARQQEAVLEHAELPVQAQAQAESDTDLQLDIRLREALRTELLVRLPAPPAGSAGALFSQYVIDMQSIAQWRDAHSVMLTLDFLGPGELSGLECWLQPIIDTGPAETRLSFHRHGDSRPQRWRTAPVLRAEQLAAGRDGLRLTCYAPRPLDEWLLDSATAVQQWPHDHRQRRRLAIGAIDRAIQRGKPPGEYRFSLPGPLPAIGFEVSIAEPGVLSKLVLYSRSSEDRPWTARAEATIDSLGEADGGQVMMRPGRALRHREWRLSSSPPIDDDVIVTTEYFPDYFLVLAQGQPPHWLHAGSARARPAAVGTAPVDDAIERLGQPWQWPVARPGSAEVVSGPQALEQPPAEVPWQRYLLWLVLGLGSLLLIVLVFRLLREPGKLQ